MKTRERRAARFYILTIITIVATVATSYLLSVFGIWAVVITTIGGLIVIIVILLYYLMKGSEKGAGETTVVSPSTEITDTFTPSSEIPEGSVCDPGPWIPDAGGYLSPP